MVTLPDIVLEEMASTRNFELAARFKVVDFKYTGHDQVIARTPMIMNSQRKYKKQTNMR